MAVLNGITLPTRRSFDWKLYWMLLGLNVPAVFALIPFARNLQEAYAGRGTEMVQGWEALLVDRIVTILLIALLAMAGLALANRIGVGLPFVERRLKSEPLPCRFRNIVAIGWLVGIGCTVLILALDIGVFREPMASLFQELDIEPPKEAVPPPLYGFLAAISAGVTEETIFRLFGLSLLAWLGGLLMHSDDGRPRPAVFWIANILFALAFGAAHLATASAIGWPMNGLVLTRTFLLNGIGGLAFGWLFWTYGLESAMLAHFFTDVGLYTLVPIIVLQVGRSGLPVAIAVVSIVVIVGVIWALWTLAREKT